MPPQPFPSPVHLFSRTTLHPPSAHRFLGDFLSDEGRKNGTGVEAREDTVVADFESAPTYRIGRPIFPFRPLFLSTHQSIYPFHSE